MATKIVQNPPLFTTSSYIHKQIQTLTIKIQFNQQSQNKNPALKHQVTSNLQMCWHMSTQNPKHNSSISSPINRFRRFLLFKLSDSSPLVFNSQITVLLQVKIKFKLNKKLDWTQHLFRAQLNGDSTQSILNNYYHFPHFVDTTVK